MRRCTLFGFKWSVHNHVLVNAFFPWKGEGGMCYISHMCGLKKGRFFFVKVFQHFRQMLFGGALTLISLRPFLFSLQRSWSFLAYCMVYFSSLFLLIKGGYIRLLFWFGFSGLTQICVVSQMDITVKPLSTDTRLYGHLIITGIVLFPWGKKALIFSLLTV